VRFAKKFGRSGFKWPPFEDISVVDRSEVQSVLPEPIIQGNRERVSLFYFDMDYHDLNVK